MGRKSINRGQLTQEYLKERMEYNPETGLAIWLPCAKKCYSTFNSRWVHKNIGHLDKNGYCVVTLDDIYYKAHVLFWFYMTGEWPPCEIDHINRIKNDNRWKNLRLATSAQNTINRGLRSNNISGTTGVFWMKRHKKWKAKIVLDGEHIHLGYYSIKEDAIAARQQAETRYYGEFAYMNV
jgi:hypothetical protein